MHVYIRKGETLDEALERFNRKVKKEELLDNYKGKRSFKSDAERRHDRDHARAQKKRQKAK